MNKEKLNQLYTTYKLNKDTDFWKKEISGRSFIIVTREGIEKIQNAEQIEVKFEAIKTETNFAVIKAKARIKNGLWLETFGSALSGKGGNYFGSYCCEMAEKRAFARAVLKVTGFYAEGVYSEDESDSFKKDRNNKKEIINLNK